jgi:hypothetical protein
LNDVAADVNDHSQHPLHDETSAVSDYGCGDTAAMEKRGQLPSHAAISRRIAHECEPARTAVNGVEADRMNGIELLLNNTARDVLT